MENETEINTKKRKLDDEETTDEPSPKRITSEAFNLVDFSDEMLLAILKYLDSPSLIKLSRYSYLSNC